VKTEKSGEAAIAAAAAFGEELRKAMHMRSATVVATATAARTSRAHISEMRTGGCLPSQAVVVRLAEALGWDRLITLSLELRTRVCLGCGREFVDRTARLHAVRCSKRCKNTHVRAIRAAARGEVIATRNVTVVRLEESVARFKDLLAVHCWSCEPDGVCRNAGAMSDDEDCVWRDVTPHTRLEEGAPEPFVLPSRVPMGTVNRIRAQTRRHRLARQRTARLRKEAS
jgi:hypothetical protein